MTGLVTVSAFAGAGGIDWGFGRAGIPTVAWSEIEPHACAVMRRHHSDAVELGDIRHVAVDAVLDAVGGRRWVLTGGVPCQDVSSAGRRAGLSGARTGLFFDWARLARSARPEWIVFENVPGLFSSEQGRDFAIVLDTLEECGYAFAWRVLDARHFGVPQRRRRIFLVGHIGNDGRSSCEVLGIPSGGGWNPAESVTPQCLFGSERGNSVADRRRSTVDVSRVDVVSTLQATGGQRIDAEGAAGGHLIVTQCHGSNIGPMGALKGDSVSAGVPFITHTLTHNSVIEDGVEVRRMTPLECERLMGWPDGHTAEGVRTDGTVYELPDSARYRLCGNGVVGTVAWWLGARLTLVGAAP